MDQPSYLEIRKQVPLMKRAPGTRINLGKIVILSNVMVNQLREILDYTLLQNGLEADEIIFTEYDTIVQSSAEVRDATAVFVFWELCNLVDGFQYKAEFWERDKTEELLQKTRGEIDYVITALAKVPIVFFNLFTGQAFSDSAITRMRIDDCAENLNQHLGKNLPANVTAVNIQQILAKISTARACDYRFFYSSKCLYTPEFFIAFAQQVVPPLLALRALSKKALILDCDNTLWQGIVGEDGIDGIQFPPAFQEVQAHVRMLGKQGVIIGLCSKNNPEDVVEVFRNRDEMILREDDLTIRRVNWQDKATNLREMAEELNIGIDSFVFIDDSEFECELVRSQIPEVAVFQRPEHLAEYPGMVRRLRSIFLSTAPTDEDRRRREMYEHEAGRKASKSSFANIDEYIRSLELRVTIAQDCEEHLPRASQLTQKTNQFNLTTRRYTEDELRAILGEGGRIYTFSLSDNFGDYGIIGVVILRYDQSGEDVVFDSFLLSCRALGRNVETKACDWILRHLFADGIKNAKALYLPTRKNRQTHDFFDRVGFLRAPLPAGEPIDAVAYLLKEDDYTCLSDSTIAIIKKDSGEKAE